MTNNKNSIAGEQKQEAEEKASHVHIEKFRLIDLIMILYDLIAVTLSFFLALWLRFDCNFSQIPEHYLMAWLNFAPFYAVISFVVSQVFHLYQSIWKFASFVELKRIICATTIQGLLHAILITVFFLRMPISYYIWGTAIQFLFITLVRFSYRFVLLERSKNAKLLQEALASRVMLIGAGAAGQMILRDLHCAKESDSRVCCIIDDDKRKHNRFIDGVPVVGGREDILLNVEKYKIEKIYFAIPSATAEQTRDILEICKETRCELKILPAIYHMYDSSAVSASKLQDVSVEDLLGRPPVRVDMTEIFAALKGKVILITGGAGSIGSELARQVAAHEPKQLILLDMYENTTYDIQLELKEKFPDVDLVVLIGSVRDSRKVENVFATYQPEIVFHAAAHKHVPLMEDSPCESIKNNAVGTYKTAYAAMRYGCKRFVLISTDKAVNPTNIMGASKRLCEMVVQGFDQKIKEGKPHEIPMLFTHCKDEDISGVSDALPENVKTEFVAVRFGNVLGSNGSVIPLFKKQIAKGGPVTVTHPDIIRYFMTIPEAVSLVLQASTYAHGGEIFVLDMGSAVKIDTLARNLIKLSGLRPDVDIEIRYTGLRPGEKLYEEKLMSEEGLKKTPNDLIHIGCPIPFDTDEFFVQLNDLMEAAYANSPDIRDLVAKVVTTYHPAGENGSEEKGKAYEAQLHQKQPV